MFLSNNNSFATSIISMVSGTNFSRVCVKINTRFDLDGELISHFMFLLFKLTVVLRRLDLPLAGVSQSEA